MNTIVDVSLYLSYALLLLGVATAVLLPVFKLLQVAPRELIKLGIGLGSMFALVLISYLLASDDAHICNCSRWVSSFLIMSYVLLFANLLGIAYMSISHYFK